MRTLALRPPAWPSPGFVDTAAEVRLSVAQLVLADSTAAATRCTTTGLKTDGMM